MPPKAETGSPARGSLKGFGLIIGAGQSARVRMLYNRAADTVETKSRSVGCIHIEKVIVGEGFTGEDLTVGGPARFIAKTIEGCFLMRVLAIPKSFYRW